TPAPRPTGSGRSEAAGRGEGGGLDEGAAQRALRERRQRFGGFGGVASSAPQGFGQRAAALQQRDRPTEIARALIAVFEGAPPEGAFLRVAPSKRDDDRQRDLAVAEIVAHGLAELTLPRREIEHVVDQLVGH